MTVSLVDTLTKTGAVRQFKNSEEVVIYIFMLLNSKHNLHHMNVQLVTNILALIVWLPRKQMAAGCSNFISTKPNLNNKAGRYTGIYFTSVEGTVIYNYSMASMFGLSNPNTRDSCES